MYERDGYRDTHRDTQTLHDGIRRTCIASRSKNNTGKVAKKTEERKAKDIRSSHGISKSLHEINI